VPETRSAPVDAQKKTPSLKQRVAEEFRMFWAIAIYLAVMLSAFIWYRRFILSESGITYLHYGAAVIEALILAKVILVGRALRLGKRFEQAPLVISALVKAVAYAVFVAIFFVLEHLIEGLVRGETWSNIAAGLVRVGWDEILARAIMAIVVFIPFFAFMEINRVLGDDRLFSLFFRRRMP
jgi:hypothetical protein